MESEPGRSLILWTIRSSVLLYALAVIVRFQRSRPSRANWKRIFGWLWTGAWVLCVIHVLCAYHFQHHWDQDAAQKHTAEMTDRVVGLYWSGGLYINYVFLILWGAHCFWWWRTSDFAPSGSEMARSDLAMQLIAGFMMFNATAVFGPQWWIAVVAAFVVILVACSWPTKKAA